MQTQNTLFNVPEQFAGVSGLGGLRSVHLVGVANRWVSAIFGGILLVAGGLVAVYGLYDTMVQVTAHGSAMLVKTITPPLLTAALLLFLGALAAVNAYRNWNRAAAVYENGLAFSDHHGVQTWTWLDVEYIYSAITKHYTNGIYTGTTYVYTLLKADGSKLVLDNKLKQIEALGQVVSRQVAPIQYDRLLQQLRSGQTVALGQVSISKESLTINKKSFPWKEIENVGINKGFINIKKVAGGWFSGATVAASAVPNLDALLAIINQIVKVRAG